MAGIGHTTRAWVESLNPLLQLDRTTETTLLSLAGRVAERRLLSRIARYCPKCNRDDIESGIQYRYLIWEIQTVIYCPVHECRLEVQPKSIRYRRARWRSDDPNEQSAKKVAEHLDSVPQARITSEVQRSVLVSKLLGSPSFRMGFPVDDSSGVASFLVGAIDSLTEGVASHMAMHLHINKSTLHGWTTGAHLPTFEQVVDIAQALNCPIESVLTGDITELPMILPDYSQPRPRKRHASHNVKGRPFRLRLINSIKTKKNQIPPPSVLEIATALGVDRTQLAHAYPDLAKQISKNREDWISRKTKLIRSIRHYAYREAAVALAMGGQLPTRNRVMNFLANISVFSTDDRELCQAICIEVRREFKLQGRRAETQRTET